MQAETRHHPTGRHLAYGLLALWLATFAATANADVESVDVLDTVLTRYQSAASGWASTVTAAATRLFWSLTGISMVWTFGMMALRRADIAEFFYEFLRFTIFTGFFWWLLTNGPAFASSIYASLRQLAGTATGLGQAMSPSGVVDVGFAIFGQVVDKSSAWSPVNSATGILVAIAILVILALVAVNMLLLLVSGWVLAYGGVFFLGFGGSRWTSDMAVNYYKTVLSVGAQLFAMVLIVGIGKTFLDDYYANMSDKVTLRELGVMLIVAVILLMLVNKIPLLIAGIVNGASVGGAGIGQFGAGAALGAAGMAAAAAATGGAAMVAGLTSAAGGVQAVMAAVSKAGQNVSTGTDVLASLGSAFQGGGTERETGGNSNSTPFAEAAGFSAMPPAVPSSFAQPRGVDAAETPNSGGTAPAEAGTPGASAAPSAGGPDPSSPGAASASGSQMAKGLSGGATAVTTAARVAADATANLAKGVGTVAADKLASMRDSFKERLADTTGGKIAAAIKAQGSNPVEPPLDAAPAAQPTFDGNSLSGTPETADPAAEIAAFVKGSKPADGRSA